MQRLRGVARNDEGETLVELMVAVAILGIAAVAILSGLILSVKASTVHGNQASGGAYVRSFAEAIQASIESGGYKATCADAENATSGYRSVTVPGIPSAYDKAVAACVQLADGLQQLELTVTTTGDTSHRAVERLTVFIRKPCNKTASVTGANPC